jgi:hypothetical protein
VCEWCGRARICGSKALNYRRFRALFQGGSCTGGKDNSRHIHPPDCRHEVRQSHIKLGATFAAFLLVIGVGVVAMLVIQLDSIDHGALLEAGHFANVIALSTSEDFNSNPERLEKHIEDLDSLYKRDVVIVDLKRKGIADANKSEVGQIFTHDPGNEVALTMADGKVRTFIEQNELHVDGAKQLVVALRRNQNKSDSPIIGAVIVEYTQIHDDLFEAEKANLYTSAALAAACVLLATLLGFRVTNKIVTGLRDLQAGVERVAKGDYAGWRSRKAC